MHPSPPTLKYTPLTLSSLPRFQLLSLLHKISLPLTLSLEHLAPLYTQPLLSSAFLSRVEVAAVNALGESNRLLAGEVGSALEGAESVSERREVVGKLKGDIVESLIHERIIAAKAE